MRKYFKASTIHRFALLFCLFGMVALATGFLSFPSGSNSSAGKDDSKEEKVIPPPKPKEETVIEPGFAEAKKASSPKTDMMGRSIENSAETTLYSGYGGCHGNPARQLRSR